MSNRRKSLLKWVVCGVVLSATSRVAEPVMADGAPLIKPALQPGPVGAEEGIFVYRFEQGRLGFTDLVTLENGAKSVGKAMEWANQILVYRSAGEKPDVFRSEDIRSIEYRRLARHRDRPLLPDLTVAFVERGSETGGPTSLKVHVLNAGGTDSRETPVRVLLDDKELFNGSLPVIKPGAAHIVEVSGRGDTASRTLRVLLDPEGHEPEVARWNNQFSEPWHARAVVVEVASDVHAAFREKRNLVDTFSFEDWAQYQVRCLNGLFRASVYGTAPEGIVERVRCAGIKIVSASEPGDGANSKADGPTPMRVVYDKATMSNPLKVNWRALKGLGLQMGLLDLSATDTELSQCLAVDRHGRFVQRQHQFAFPHTLLHTPGGFALSEVCAGFLNSRPSGSPEARQSLSELLPKSIAVVVRSNSGQALQNVQVDVYQLQTTGELAGRISGVAAGDPLYSAPTGVGGFLALIPQEPQSADDTFTPNPFGRIEPDGSNGLLLLKLRWGPGEEYHFITLFDCLLAYFQGHQDEYVIDLRTLLGDPEAPNAPGSTAIIIEDRTEQHPPMYATWRWPADTPVRSVDEYRVYRKCGLGADTGGAWTLVNTLRRGEGDWLMRSDVNWAALGDHSDALFAVTAVNPEGWESSLSAPGYLAMGTNSVKFALDGEAGYTTLTRPGSMLRWDGEVATQPFGVRNLVIKGYEPSMAGIAVTADRRIVMTDPVNHVLAFYSDKGELEDVYPRRSLWPGFASDDAGEFNMPWDVAVDGVGRIYVADYGNNRVQILDQQLSPLGYLDADAEFRGPHAVACSNGRLCVTDRQGSRCRIYDVKGDQPVFERELPRLTGADRALVSRSGKVYITAQMAKDKPVGIFVFSPDGSMARFEQALFEVEMGKVFSPRGLYLYVNQIDEDYGYCVNEFPYDVRRILLQ